MEWSKNHVEHVASTNIELGNDIVRGKKNDINLFSVSQLTLRPISCVAYGPFIRPTNSMVPSTSPAVTAPNSSFKSKSCGTYDYAADTITRRCVRKNEEHENQQQYHSRVTEHHTHNVDSKKQNTIKTLPDSVPHRTTQVYANPRRRCQRCYQNLLSWNVGSYVAPVLPVGCANSPIVVHGPYRLLCLSTYQHILYSYPMHSSHYIIYVSFNSSFQNFWFVSWENKKIRKNELQGGEQRKKRITGLNDDDLPGE